jgi:glutamyl-tRNA synthetase
VQVIFEGMKWLGLEADERRCSRPPAPIATDRGRRDAGARLGLSRLHDPEELEAERTHARAEGRVVRSPWRDLSPNDAPDRPFVVRLKARSRARRLIDDQVKGLGEVPEPDLDDLILLRTDGTPTYNLAVVVDDHEMGVTHVIRGDDHLNNAARQTLIYQGSAGRRRSGRTCR